MLSIVKSAPNFTHLLSSDLNRLIFKDLKTCSVKKQQQNIEQKCKKVVEGKSRVRVTLTTQMLHSCEELNHACH